MIFNYISLIFKGLIHVIRGRQIVLKLTVNYEEKIHASSKFYGFYGKKISTNMSNRHASLFLNACVEGTGKGGDKPRVG